LLIFNKNNKTQKATTAIAPASFPSTIFVQPTQGLIAGDRGCLPIVGFSAALQTTTQELTLQIAGMGGGLAEYSRVVLLLCKTSGTCCTTDLCNTMSRIEMSSASMIISIVLALIGVFKGF
jgi:hypothetical protein